MGLLERVRTIWHARQRKIDLEILWPVCLDAAESLDEARAVFALHAYNDRAWLCLDPNELSYLLHHLEDTRQPRFVVVPAEELFKTVKNEHP
jgi:hypothetical protein